MSRRLRIVSAEAFRYRLEVNSAEGETGISIPDMESKRDGILIRLGLENNGAAWGEVAPLPGRSRETLVEAETELVQSLSSLVGYDIPGTWADFRTENPAGSSLASVRTGLEQAMAELAARSAGLPVATWVNPRARTSVPVNALLSGPDDMVIDTTRVRLGEGFRVFKLKVGDRSAAELRMIVDRILDTVGTGAELRLDANRKWTYEEAAGKLDGLTNREIAYVEEPLAEPSLLRKFAGETSVPVALDESISEMVHGQVPPADHSFARAGILKPTLVGGMIRTMALAENLVASNVEPVITSAFESEIGLAGLVQLAAALPGDGWAAGLDTARNFARGILRSPHTGPHTGPHTSTHSSTVGGKDGHGAPRIGVERSGIDLEPELERLDCIFELHV